MFYPGKFDPFLITVLYLSPPLHLLFSILGRHFADQNVFNRLHKCTLNKDETEFLCQYGLSNVLF